MQVSLASLDCPRFSHELRPANALPERVTLAGPHAALLQHIHYLPKAPRAASTSPKYVTASPITAASLLCWLPATFFAFVR